MKTIILVFTAMAITAGVYAQSGSTNSKTSPQDPKTTQNQNLQNQQNLNNTQNQNLQNQQDLNRTRNQQDMNMTQGQNNSGNCLYSGVVMLDGKLMKMENGVMTPFQENEMTLLNGTKVMSDGTYHLKNGSRLKMKEGYHMDMAGNIMVPLKTTYGKDGTPHGQIKSTDRSSTDRTNNTQSGTQSSTDKSSTDRTNNTQVGIQSGQNSSTDKSSTDRTNNATSGNQNVQNNSNTSTNNTNFDEIVMENGKLMKVKNGQKTVLQDNDVTFSNGTKIMSDGTYIKKDGTKLTIKEGQYIDKSGNIVTTKTDKDKTMYLVPDSTLNRDK